MGVQELEGYKITRVTLGIEEKLFQNLKRQVNMASPCDPVCGHPCKKKYTLRSELPTSLPTPPQNPSPKNLISIEYK